MVYRDFKEYYFRAFQDIPDAEKAFAIAVTIFIEDTIEASRIPRKYIVLKTLDVCRVYTKAIDEGATRDCAWRECETLIMDQVSKAKHKYEQEKDQYQRDIYMNERDRGYSIDEAYKRCKMSNSVPRSRHGSSTAFSDFDDMANSLPSDSRGSLFKEDERERRLRGYSYRHLYPIIVERRPDGSYRGFSEPYQNDDRGRDRPRDYQTEERRPGGGGRNSETRDRHSSGRSRDYHSEHTRSSDSPRDYQTEERRPQGRGRDYHPEDRRSSHSSREHPRAEDKRSGGRTRTTKAETRRPRSPPRTSKRSQKSHDRTRPPQDSTNDKSFEVKPPICLYTVLEISRSASPSDIKTAYRKLCMKWHPDRAGKADEKKATEMMASINQANDVLSNAEMRRYYDKTGYLPVGR